MESVIYLIPSVLGNGNTDKVLPQFNKNIVNELDCFIVEEIRTARRFLKEMGYKKDFNEVTFFVLNEHTEPEEISDFLKPAEEGKSIGIISESGCPAVADPGAEIVRLAHKKNITVIPLTGPSSILLSLMASGFNGQNFTFLGYLPVEKKSRVKKIKEIERDAYNKSQTQIFIETPYRNHHLLNDILNVCNYNTMLCIACDITLPAEFIKSKTIAEWRKSIPDINKRPAIFLLYKD
ncbi:MAG: SAM-dependent methyltransferase [Bacteroidales bacterium]|nr:SAM-dependent methyltransferase [Bacteroidales bacterium]